MYFHIKVRWVDRKKGKIEMIWIKSSSIIETITREIRWQTIGTAPLVFITIC